MAAATMVAYYAHSGREPDLSDGQRLKKHLLAVALGAASKAALFGAENAAHLAGLLHDLGKYTLRFLARLRGGPRVDHARAGALVVRSLPDAEPRMRSLLAYVIAGHHAGLHDAHELRRWLDDDDACPTPDPVWRQEIEPDGRALLPPWVGSEASGFQLAFLGRMIFSCLIDADRSDTAGFDRAVHGVAPPDPWPALAAIVDTLRDRLSARLAGFKQDRDIDRLCRSILDHARAKAALDPGFFTLTVPTGGGKTLTSLAFALDHAKTHRLERIVYSIPFTGARIETSSMASRASPACESPPTRGRGSKRDGGRRRRLRPASPPRGDADRNFGSAAGPQFTRGRPPRGGADRCRADHACAMAAMAVAALLVSRDGLLILAQKRSPAASIRPARHPETSCRVTPSPP